MATLSENTPESAQPVSGENTENSSSPQSLLNEGRGDAKGIDDLENAQLITITDAGIRHGIKHSDLLFLVNGEELFYSLSDPMLYRIIKDFCTNATLRFKRDVQQSIAEKLQPSYHESP